MLNSITPVLLTCNDGPNIDRVLAKLDWASEIVVVDSGSADETLPLLKSNRRVRVFHRDFDNHPAQWRYAMEGTGVKTEWVLRLDSDYMLSDGFEAELARLRPGPDTAAYLTRFDYAVFSRKLVSSLYPPKPVLLRMGRFAVTDQGHTEGWTVHGGIVNLRSRITHDDWKSMRVWTVAQAHYMSREVERLRSRRRGLRDWLRLHPPLMPIAVFFYCLFVKRLLFSGRAGLLYTLQRTIAEAILSLFIMEAKLNTGQASAEDTLESRGGLQGRVAKSGVPSHL